MKVGFGKEWKDKNSIFDFPKLKLESGERARIAIIDAEPECEFVHQLRKVATGDHGKPLMEEKERRDGTTYEVPQTEFKGKFICLGEPDTLFEHGVDPDNCPACKAAIENSSAISRPDPRFVVNVLKYNLKKNTTTPATPFHVELQAWEFPLSRMRILKGLADEHGNLNEIDLLLGPVEPPVMFQKYPVSTASTCEWRKNESNTKTAVEIIKNSQEDDVTPLLGRRVSFAELRTQVYEIVAAYNEAFGIPGAIPQATAPETQPNVSALLNGSGQVKSDTAEESSEDEDVASEEEVSDGDEPETQDLQSLLASLGK